MVLVLGLWFVSSRANQPDPTLYSFLCGSTSIVDGDTEWNVVIYMDVDACISCSEDMEAWQRLETELPQYNGVLTLWAPVQDSLDVAVAMELEGLTTPVRVADSTALASLRWLGKPTPIKVLLDSDCRPKRTVMPVYSLDRSRRVIQQLLDDVRNETGSRP